MTLTLRSSLGDLLSLHKKTIWGTNDSPAVHFAYRTHASRADCGPAGPMYRPVAVGDLLCGLSGQINAAKEKNTHTSAMHIKY